MKAVPSVFFGPLATAAVLVAGCSSGPSQSGSPAQDAAGSSSGTSASGNSSSGDVSGSSGGVASSSSSGSNGGSGSGGGSGGSGSGSGSGSSSGGADDAAAPDGGTMSDASVPDAGAGDTGMQVAPGSCAPGMARIPAKNQSFLMGFDPSEAPGTIWACYLGKHKVTFTHDYCMDAKLVTQAEFSTLMGFNPSKHQTGDLTLPVDSETWYDAVLYCNAKSRAAGLQAAYSYGAVTLNGKSASNIANVKVDITQNGYRLPTNAEYEYAERANTTGLYFFSPTATANITALGAVYAWYSGNSGTPAVSQPVGGRKPNPWGLYDIVGNLFEWENDWEGPYVTTDEVDPLGPATGTGCGTFGIGVQKMAKGGSWHTDVATHMRVSYHFKWAPSAVHPELGFRCVATAN